MSKILKKAALIILIILLVIGGTLALLLSQMADSMGVGNAGVADYDKRIEIWEHPAGYSKDLKIDHMNAAGTAPDVICVKSEDPLDRCLELIREDCLH